MTAPERRPQRSRAPRPLRQFGPATLPSGEILQARADFLWVREQGRSLSSRLLVLNVAPAPDGNQRVGFLTSRRFHRHAVQRNRARRQLREVYRLSRNLINQPVWLVLIPRHALRQARTAELQREFLHLLDRAGLRETGDAATVAPPPEAP